MDQSSFCAFGCNHYLGHAVLGHIVLRPVVLECAVLEHAVIRNLIWHVLSWHTHCWGLHTWETSVFIKPLLRSCRAALAPFLANKTAAPGSYKWILYGDDDTFWFIDNVLAYLDQLDPDMPYLLSDNIWLKERTSGMCNGRYHGSCVITSLCCILLLMICKVYCCRCKCFCSISHTNPCTLSKPLYCLCSCRI